MTAAEIAANKYFASTHATVHDATTAATVGNWFTAHNNNPAASKDSVKNAHELTAFADYVITKTVYLTLADGSDPAHNLTVTPTITLKDYYLTTDAAPVDGKTYYTKSGDTYTAVGSPDSSAMSNYYEHSSASDITGVKVLVATGDNYVILNSTMTTAQSLYGTTDQTLRDTTATKVDIYIYYDGEEAAVRTANIDALAGAEIDLQFNVAVGAGA